MAKYKTAPVATDKMPESIPYILCNETAERFAFYGMSSILTVFLANHLVNAYGKPEGISEEQTLVWVHFFKFAVYFLPILGALLADAFLGKFKTIIIFSILYCFGFLAMVIDQTSKGTIVGMVLIAIGAGMIKACLQANVGDQFGKTNKHLIERFYSWFYFAVNLGACLTSFLAPVLLYYFGPKVAFGVPGILMVAALGIYWFSRFKLVHIPASGIGFVKETFSGEGIAALAKLSVIYLFVAVFWALFDQSTTAWVLQAQDMNRFLFGKEILPSQLQAINAALVVIMIPLFTYLLYPAVNKVVRVTPLRKISTGFFVAIPSFVIPAWIEIQIAAGRSPHIIWHFIAYLFLTAAEILISITIIEFSYTQSPNKMKSFISSISLLPIAVGNAFVVLVSIFIQNPDGTSKLEGADYYWFYTIAMAVTAVLFIFVAMTYKPKTYIQQEAPE